MSFRSIFFHLSIDYEFKSSEERTNNTTTTLIQHNISYSFLHMHERIDRKYRTNMR